jgi:hypothetical protein
VLGIALRLAAIGASERALAAPDSVATRRMERRLFGVCAGFSLAAAVTSTLFAHVMDESGGCGDGRGLSLAHNRPHFLKPHLSCFKASLLPLKRPR